MENSMGKKIKQDLNSKLTSKITDAQSSAMVNDILNSFPSDLPESEKIEATGASSAGGYTAPLFGDMKEQDEQTSDLTFYKSKFNSYNCQKLQ